MTGSAGTDSGSPGAPVPVPSPPRWYAITGTVVATSWISGLALGIACCIWTLSGA